MKIKRISALLLAALMLYALVPSAAFAGEAVTEKDVGADVLEPYMNHFSCQIRYTASGFVGKTGVDMDGNLYNYVESNIAGQPNATASITSEEIYMEEGERVSFYIKVDTEDHHDFFRFYVNGVQNYEFSGPDYTGEYWLDHLYFDAPSSGNYYFRWVYQKDGSGDYGADCVRIRNVVFSRHLDWFNIQAALKEGNAGNCIGCGNYSYRDFAAYYSDDPEHPFYLRSQHDYTNYDAGCGLYFWVDGASEEAPVYLNFDYLAANSAYQHDLVFYDNGVSIFVEEGSDDLNWKSYSHPVTTNGLHFFQWVSRKEWVSPYLYEVYAGVDNVYMTSPDSGGRATSLYNGLNASNSDAWLVFNAPDGALGFTSCNTNDGDGCCAVSNNRFLDNSVASISTDVNMAAGEKLMFDYYVSSEPGNDYLTFYANNEQQMASSGWAFSGWNTFIFTAPSLGTYHFEWFYVKDDSQSLVMDQAQIRNVRYVGSFHNECMVGDFLLNSYANDRNVYFFSRDQHDYTDFMPGYVGGSPAVMSCNKFYHDTSSYLYGEVSDIAVGDTIHFEYRVDSESYETLSFNVADASDKYVYCSEMFNGEDGDDWHEFEWTSTASGYCQINFIFEKDYSVNAGADRAFIRNFYIESNGQPSLTLDDILNPYGQTDMELHFEGTGDYPFIPELSDNGGSYAISTNQGVGGSSSVMETYALLAAGDRVWFSYDVDSESGYDVFKFFADNTCVMSASGSQTQTTYSWTAPSSGYYHLRWEYVKDGSVNSGRDEARVYNVGVTVAQQTSSGDANGDGVVDITDALLVLRYAMGIVDSIPGAAGCDANGDGTIDMTDALIILRIALGLIDG